MTERIVARGNTVFFDFTFYDQNDDVAVVTSAEVQLTYPGASTFETETVALTNNANVWSGEWSSTRARPGWVEYHARADDGVSNFAEDGRFRLTGNRANLDHDRLPTGGTQSDYELTP